MNEGRFMCGVCGTWQTLLPGLPSLHESLSPAFRRLFQAQSWAGATHACPACLWQIAQQVEQERSPHPLQEKVQNAFPVYHREETAVIPTPDRINANPYFTGRGVTIAFLDSGIYPHPDLEGRMVMTVDATRPKIKENAHFGKPHYRHWHGLITTSICAGDGHLSGGLYRGIVPHANLVLVKTGHHGRSGISEADIERALRWVLVNRERFNIRVINISLGGDIAGKGRMTALDAAVEEAVAAGLVVVAAVGNDGRSPVLPPASAPSIIAVGGLDDGNSVDPRHYRMYHSTWGKGVAGLPRPDVIAPARWLAAPILPETAVQTEAHFLHQLLHSRAADLRRLTPTALRPAKIRQMAQHRWREQKYIAPDYQLAEGTSMSTAVISGLVAQLLEANPRLTPAEVKQILLSTATPLPKVPARQQGVGYVNGGRALATAVSGAIPSANPALFTLVAPTAFRVDLIGNLTGWQALPMSQIAPTVWQISCPPLPTEPTVYQFLVYTPDGIDWIADPTNPQRLPNGFGSYYSIQSVEKK